MSITVRTRVLGERVISTTALTPVYTCPASARAIVKYILTQNTSGVSAGLAITLTSALTGNVQLLLHPTGVANGEGTQHSVWAVMMPGDVLSAVPSAAPWRIHVSGAELAV